MSNSKKIKFIKLAERRMSNALNQIRLIKNLSNKNNYDYSEEDWKLMYKDLKIELERMKAAFSDNSSKKKKWQLKK